MKRILHILLIPLLLFSCQQIELEFSCDPVIDNYIKVNREMFSVITLDEFLSYSLPMQKAIFNSWDAWKKRDIWIEKLEIVAKDETLTVQEVDHIQQVIEHIHSNYFVAEILESEMETRIQFFTKWIDDAKNNFEWTNKRIAFVVYRLYTDEIQFENELSELKSLEKSTITSAECNCSRSADFCGNAICISSSCSVNSGCGWIWSQDCDGLCYF